MSNHTQSSTKTDPIMVYTPTEAARKIEATLGARIPRSSIYRLIADGRLDHQRMGQRILIPEQALWEFLERCQRGERY